MRARPSKISEVILRQLRRGAVLHPVVIRRPDLDRPETIKVECEKANNFKPSDLFTLAINPDLTLTSINPATTRAAIDRLASLRGIMQRFGGKARQTEIISTLKTEDDLVHIHRAPLAATGGKRGND